MQHTPPYRTDRGPFSTRYLEDALPETTAWNAIDAADLRETHDAVSACWERNATSNRTDAARGESVVRGVARALNIPVPEADRGETGGGCETDAVAVAPVGERDHSLDTSGRDAADCGFRVPDYRIHEFLRETPARWAVLTNGRRWRLYRASGIPRPDAYYEIDLPAVLERDREAFKYFYCFFRREAFLDGADGTCFCDEVANGSERFAEELAADLEETAADALAVLAEGFRRHPDNGLGDDPDEETLELLSRSSLVYLYRLLFGFAAERESDSLAGTTDRGERADGLHSLKREIATKLDGPEPAYRLDTDDLQTRLDDLFERIDEKRTPDTSDTGGALPTAGGWLFDTAPDDDARRELRFLATHAIGDAFLATAIDRLARRPTPTDGDAASDRPFVDYSALDARRLGDLYEGLLERTLTVADEPSALEDGGESSGADAVEELVGTGGVRLTTERGERKTTGSYYTPASVVEYIVEHTLEPLVTEIREDVQATRDDREFAAAFARSVFDLDVLDPAMGCGRFLTRVVEYLACEILDAQAEQAARAGPATIEASRDVHWARRRVAERCPYGVDRDPIAVELARLSLWLRTLPAERPPASLGHRLRSGNALVGCDREAIDELAPAIRDRDGTTTGAEPASRGEFEGGPAGVRGRRSRRYRRLEAMANVRTALEFGLDGVPDDAVERMAAAVDDAEAWDRLAREEWFDDAQQRADAEGYFHWPLAFPEILGDAGASGSTGFDAVVGNPPWVATAGRTGCSASMDSRLRSYLADAFETTREQFDLYVAFYEQAVRRSRDGRVGIVVPDSILVRDQSEPIREFVLGETPLSRLVRIGTAFPGVETGAVVCISAEATGEIRCADASDRSSLTSLSYDRIPERVFEERNATRFLLSLDEEMRSIVETVEQHPPLEAFATVSRGEELGKRAARLTASGGPDRRPIVPGSAVHRYGLEDDEIRYIRPEDVAKREEIYRSPKLVFRQTGDSLVGTYDAADRATIKSAYTVRTDSGSSDELKHLLGVLNSPLLNCYHHYTRAAYRAVFPQINQSTVDAFPIALEDGPDPALVDAVDDRLALTSERSGISPDVLEHLGEYDDGDRLGDLDGCRRAVAVATTKLTATTAEWPDLRIGAVDVRTAGSPVVVSATIRYKPDDASRETDRWGYAETELRPALEICGVGEERRLLLEAFVPAAVDRGSGFAGFRNYATKTTSPLERVAAITLPRLADVADGLREFEEARARAAALDERIATIDERIADRVFDRYGVTGDERARVRREFGGEDRTR
ncbi:Eco57I restriction-modification methylase domain-containing protein [Natrinema salsiterrestre]|uniref:site-specific DNA-methyltransferase (adenine-specific) n=1 Tax=Natrinema salsiterrestre TaxID=2950540 RepID=A0A9Q4L066_9EURY|nr:TaqI-like C-terminal specificity domain-containing protein [Natrinema salsiterrestre]MDF9745566.1 restriction endonuclease [Natrinema salsiterrestre]